MSSKKGARVMSDAIRQKRKDAHRLHHKIADFTLFQDTRDHPPKLRNLVKEYHKKMAEIDAMEKQK